MQEVTVKDAPFGAKVYMDEGIDLHHETNNESDIIASILEAVISEQFIKYTKRKAREKPKKKKGDAK